MGTINKTKLVNSVAKTVNSVAKTVCLYYFYLFVFYLVSTRGSDL